MSEVVIGAPYTVNKDLLDHFKVGISNPSFAKSMYVYHTMTRSLNVICGKQTQQFLLKQLALGSSQYYSVSTVPYLKGMFTG